MNQTYIVKAGDTLYGISNQFGVSVTELASINNVKAETLQIGQVLTIPSNSGTNPNNMFMYTVEKGDSLYSISRKYNISVDDIIKLNNLSSNSLSIGQVIRIPEMYTPQDQMIMPKYINYTVKMGDTLYSIAKANNVDIDIIIKDNGLASNSLSIGQVLKIRIPNDSVESIEECFGEEYIPEDAVQIVNYTVQKGDSLYSISRKYNTSVSKIKELNNLLNNNLSIGQVLKIPNSINSGTSNIYVVQKGDSLYSIARKFNTTVESIKKNNNLINNLLSIGQKIII